MYINAIDKLVWMQRYSFRWRAVCWPGRRQGVLAVTRSSGVTRCRRVNGMRIRVSVNCRSVRPADSSRDDTQ